MNKQINASLLSVLITSMLVLGGVALTDDNVYKCEDRSLAMVCDGLTKYYGLDNGKCINKDVGNKVCRSGWIPFEKETLFNTHIDEQTGREYLCNQINCTEIIKEKM